MFAKHDFRPDPEFENAYDVPRFRHVHLDALRGGLTASDLDMAAEATSEEKLALRFRFLIIVSAALAPWICAVGAYQALFA